VKQLVRTHRAHVAIAALTGVLGLATACTPDGGRAGEGGTDGSSGVEPIARACAISEVGRSPVALSPGTGVYVEPHALSVFGDGFLLAGHPVIDWTVPDSGPAAMTSQGRFLGVLSVGGELRSIPRPPGVAPIEWLRMVPRGPSVWGFLLDEAATEDGPGRIVYAEFDGAEWSEPEVVSVPDGGTVDVSMGSALRVDDSGVVMWAGRFQSSGPSVDVLVFRRTQAGWTSSVGAREWVDETDIYPGGSGEFWLAVTALDPEYESRRRSVRIFAPGEPLEHTLSVALPADFLQDPVFARGPGGLSLAWRHVGSAGAVAETWLQRAVIEVVDGDGIHAPPVLLDAGAALLQGLTAPDGSTLWFTYHISPVTESETLRITRDDGVNLSVLFDRPYPFVGLFRAAIDGSGDILVAGPLIDMDPLSPSVRSLLLRLSLSCT